MANYHIGLDFGTSQTKVCLLNRETNVREFVRFKNGSFFLPSLIVKKPDNTFSYGNEETDGVRYRYFKMSAAEDEDLIQTTNEDLDGNLNSTEINSFRKYLTEHEIKPEVLVIQYLTYTYLYIKKTKRKRKRKEASGLLGRLAGNNRENKNTYSINLGIPTEWYNPNHVKRKIKFQSLLITAVELSKHFQGLKQFLEIKQDELHNKIFKITSDHSQCLAGFETEERGKVVEELLKENYLSVLPESAAGINYLLKTKRLANGALATLDVGAGTSDIAIFEVRNNQISRYYCSESTSIASNDFYREYAKQYYRRDNITFDEIKDVEKMIKEDTKINVEFYRQARRIVKGEKNFKGIEFAIRKAFYRNFYLPCRKFNSNHAINTKASLRDKPIILFGGGANLDAFCSGEYCFHQGNHPLGNHNSSFQVKSITDYVQQVGVADDHPEISESINLLIVALGLTYGKQNSNFIPFNVPKIDFQGMPIINNNRYFYYDIQDAVYK